MDIIELKRQLKDTKATQNIIAMDQSCADQIKNSKDGIVRLLIK